jgi:hypothetical protein
MTRFQNHIRHCQQEIDDLSHPLIVVMYPYKILTHMHLSQQ